MMKPLSCLSWGLFLVVMFYLLTAWVNFSHNSQQLDKGAPFECGFYPPSSPSVSFSMPFFIISLMFLLFDVEILLVSLKPMGGILTKSKLANYWLVLMMILSATLFEWYKGLLKWI